MIVETQNAETFGRKNGITARIAFEVLRLKMLSAIDLDHEMRRVTYEVRDVGAHWRLPPETSSIQPVGAYGIPNNALCVRLGAAE
jgi:hypothetical protein